MKITIIQNPMDQLIIMNQKEAKRYEIIQKTINKELTGKEAAKILNLTDRQIRRIKAKIKEKGLQGIIHANRGKTSNRKIPEKERKKIIQTIKEKYYDFGPTFAAEKLQENHQIKRDPKTIRNLMIQENIWKPKRKKKEKHRHWRQRRASYGELVQHDGSYEFWFENRGEKCCLLASIDDAEGRIIQAKFAEHEGVEPTFNFWKEYIETHGKPHEIYVDKFSTYSMNHKIAKENQDTLTQFERAMRQLNIGVIKANSSQAKGRVERLFETLQDRLIKELRLNNISTIEEANKFLKKVYIKKFNDQFSVQPRFKTNLHKKLTAKERKELPSIFSRHYARTIRNDYTLSFKNDWYQIKETPPLAIFPKETVTVEESFDKTIRFKLRGKYLNYEKMPEKPVKISLKPAQWVLTKNIPSKNHPWRKLNINQ